MDVTKYLRIVVFIFFTTVININAQVGIGTTTVNNDALLELDASQTYGGLLPPRVRLLRTSSPTPLGAHIQGMTVYNTDDRNDVKPGKYFNDGSKWVRVEGADIVDSISLTNDILVEYKTANGGFTNLIDLVFTARKENVMLLFTSSGLGYTGAMSTVHFRFRLRSNSPSANVIIGGTMNKIQDYTDAFYSIYSITPWSTSYSKVLTGLTIGKEYTVRLQGRVTGVFGGSNYYDAAIYPVTFPDSNHLTISVIQ